jgi:sigma-B regulation protein RsbU (phosphoserine phosphatase)
MSRLLKIYLALIVLFFLLSIFDFSWTESIRGLVKAAVIILTIYYFTKLTRKLTRKLLWRIRRKLILSYIFIGFIPICLLLVLFLLGFFIFMGQATSEMLNSALDGYVLATKVESEKLLHLTEFLSMDVAVSRWFNELEEQDRKWLSLAEITLSTPGGDRLLRGSAMQKLPEWAEEKNFSGLVFRGSLAWIVAIHHDVEKKLSLQIHVPVGSSLLDLIKKRINADIHYVPFSMGQSAENEFKETMESTKNQPVWPRWWDFPIWWLSLPDQYDWATGKKGSIISVGDQQKQSSDLLTVDEKGDIQHNQDARIGAFWVSTNVSRVYNHIFARSTALQKFVYVLMMVVAIFFCVIELVSLISGFLLARSITASVHNLFEGTERIKKGDLNYKIKVTADDQLGDLAASFNSMTESIKDLLVERSEKERLEESLRIARQMQQNLLPREITSAGNIDIATLNLPAQEVCGDYYDIIRMNDGELGVIIADVSGKGPSAALYMAEVKGVVLSLSRSALVPRELLLEANSILSPTLDSKSFITMTYAMISERKRHMKISRAGHNPMLQYCTASGTLDVVQPGGIGLGLGRNGIFEKSLEQVEKTLCSGDILVFYTDGLTEAMNAEKQLYGLSRLSNIIFQNKDQSTTRIKDAILRDLEQFLNHSEPQDDITLVLLKIQ